jgi:TnpA family transposase
VLSRLKAWLDRLTWLSSLQWSRAALAEIPAIKVKHFAAEAKTLDAARMKELDRPKRYTLVVAFLSIQYARTLDDLAELTVRRLRKLHQAGKEALAQYRLDMQNRTDQSIGALQETVVAYRSEGGIPQRFAAIERVLGDRSEQLLDHCEAHMAYVGNNNNYFSFLPKFYLTHRKALMDLLEILPLHSSTQDTSLEEAIRFIHSHRHSRKQWLPTEIATAAEGGEGEVSQTVDLSWIPKKWWTLVTGQSKRLPTPEKVHRTHFEICVLSHVSLELQSGDLYIEGSHEYGNYSQQMIEWDEYREGVEEYGGASLGLPVHGKRFVERIKQWLADHAAETDRSIPQNSQVNFQQDRLVIRRHRREFVPGLSQLKWEIAQRIQPIGVLELLADTEAWLNWTRFFGPISGFDAKIEHPTERYLMTTFCYGCQLGPSQTAKSLEQIDARQLAWVDRRHIQEETLQKAIVTTIDAYNRFSLLRFWGSGRRASVDGTKWDIYENNLLAEYHIRYGGYGGVGYYHVSDTYIALFSHFIPFGVWEAVHMLDGLLHNHSVIQPDTIHGDTQAQSAAVFALAYLLDISLMPRIRGWQGLTFHRPSRSARYQHLDSLFDDVTDWGIIETHLPDMLRVVMSIKAGKIEASTILRKLGTNSRKNKLFQAFHELGTALRTGFLLDYLNDVELRATIQSATNKSESFNNRHLRKRKYLYNETQ